MTGADDSPALQKQRALNSGTRDGWASFAPHRAHVTSRLLQLSSPDARLLVLGAGNCNDLDLPSIAGAFKEVTLLDWDEQALERGLRAQFPSGAPSIRLWGGVEVTAWLPGLVAATAMERPSTIEHFLTREVGPSLPANEGFEVVASTCLLSQLIDIANSVVDPAQQPAVAARLRWQHLSLIGRLLKPGGTGLLITDFVSSDTAPSLMATDSSADLKLLAQQFLTQGNFFVGLHPGHLVQDLLNSPRLAAHTSITVSEPWLWALQRRRYMVLAVSFQKPE